MDKEEEEEEKVVVVVDPETEFLWSKEESGNEWEVFKENVRPLKRGRNIRLLNHALKSQTDYQLKKSLLDYRRTLIQAVDDYIGDDPLQPWLQCIKWVQEAFPPGGDYSGLVVIYEQCVRTFWHQHRYKDDLRYLKVWLEYAENCADAEVIYNFLDANQIGQTHSVFFISYALHMESKNKIRTANDIFNNGISRNARPVEKLEEAYKKFLARSMRRQKAIDGDLTENRLPLRSFGTVLAKGDSRTQKTRSSDLARKKMKPDGAQGAPLTIYKDTNADVSLSHQSELSKTDLNSWHILGARSERNKENTAMPAKWTSTKIPQRPGFRTGGVNASATIEVFVDEECAKIHKVGGDYGNSTTLQLRHGDGREFKRETELLKENPLRNFPPNCLPR